MTADGVVSPDGVAPSPPPADEAANSGPPAAEVVSATLAAPDESGGAATSAPAAVVPVTEEKEEEEEPKRRRRGWTEEEEKRLREGVAQHGAGQWAKIRDSYGFKSENEGEGRTCVNLKDKWRNLNRSPRAEKPPKQVDPSPRPPRKKKTPKRKRDSEDPAPAAAVWIPSAEAWCKANLEKISKGKVHVSALRTKFANSAEFFPGKEVFGDDETEIENLKYDLENPKTEASKKFRSDALEKFVGADAIRQNCFIGGLNQLGVFGWAVKGEEASPPARSASKDAPPQDVAALVSAEAAKLIATPAKETTEEEKPAAPTTEEAAAEADQQPEVVVPPPPADAAPVVEPQQPEVASM